MSKTARSSPRGISRTDDRVLDASPAAIAGLARNLRVGRVSELFRGEFPLDKASLGRVVRGVH